MTNATVTIQETHDRVVAYVNGDYFGSATSSGYTMKRIGRRVKWGVSVKGSSRGGYGHTKAQAVAQLKRMIRDRYDEVKYQ